jgi:hypothetical protein
VHQHAAGQLTLFAYLQTYPELEVSPTVQAAALLGAGLLHRGTCHRCSKWHVPLHLQCDCACGSHHRPAHALHLRARLHDGCKAMCPDEGSGSQRRVRMYKPTFPWCRRMAEIMVQELGRRASDDAGANANSGVTGRCVFTTRSLACIAEMLNAHVTQYNSTGTTSLHLTFSQVVAQHDVAAAYPSARTGKGTRWRRALRWASSCWARGTQRPACPTCSWTTDCGTPVTLLAVVHEMRSAACCLVIRA